MPKQKLFDDDSEEEVAIKTENEYAKKYDSWRQKEELHKLEQKYGSKALDGDGSSSDSEDDDDEPPEVTEEMEAQFLKTLSLLKTKDPRIYDPNFKCFDEEEEKVEEKKPETNTLTFEDSDEDESDNDGNIFKIEKKAEVITKEIQSKQTSDKSQKEGKLKDYLTGKAEHLEKDIEKDLAPLKALWSDPKLNEGEAFLRDYILNKRYLEEGDVGDAEEKIRDDEDLEEDEKRVEEQGQFERAYNFRFEEPDQEYLKRFPRTMNYIRPKDDSRSRKRAELRARKEEEKKRKMEEIARMKALKLKEIQEKIAKIKEITGNQDLAFEDRDIEGDFDPEEHDRRMKALFDEQFYGQVDDEKPTFPELDEELEIENWDNYETENYNDVSVDQNEDEPHCEDEDFNMDADYDPKQARATLLEEIQSNLGKKRRNRKKQSKLAKLLEAEKPKFIPHTTEKSYNEYMEEYYKMDCEDVIGGDLPTRFKYREVVPNDFGLTIEEILLADDKELTQWVPLKKLVKHRPAEVEKSEINTYRIKAADERLKRKILPSLFKDLPEEPELVVPVEEATKKKNRKKKKNKTKDSTEQVYDSTEQNIEETNTGDSQSNSQDTKEENSINTEQSTIKKQKKHDKQKLDENDTNFGESKEHSSIPKEGNSKKKKLKNNNSEENKSDVNIASKKENKVIKNDIDNTKHNSETNVDIIKNKTKDKSGINQEIPKRKITNFENKSKSLESNVVSSTKTHPREFKGTVSNETVLTNGESKKKKRKKRKSDGFTVENVEQQTPSKVGDNKNSLKRKMHSNSDQVANKKRKNKHFEKNDFNKQKQKGFKHKQGGDKSENPMNTLSDERLKAYGLNPKKYRSFLKYKKF